MFIPQTLKNFIENPNGAGSTALGNKKLLRDDLNRRYLKLTQKKKITVDIYRDKEEYYFHFKIPSETERSNTYDVVLYFTMGDDKLKYDNFINNYYVLFFSNCPSFIYTFAYAYNMYELLIPHLKNKYDHIVLNQNPIIRNPGEIINYDKSIYFACHFIQENRKYLNKQNLNTMAKPFNNKQFNDIIRHSDKIIIETKKENNRIHNEKQQLKEKDVKRNKLARVTNKISKTIHKIEPMKKITPRKSNINKT